jgi:AAA domain
MTARSKKTFEILTDEELESLPDPEWLVERLITERAAAMVFGPSGVGKSFFAINMLLSIATGTAFFGFPTRQGRVLYVAGEGHGGMKKRVQAWKRSHALARVPDAFFILNSIDLADREEVEALIAQLSEVNPAVVVFDTLAQCSSADENAAEEMRPVLQNIGLIQERLRAAVVVLHHSTKAKKEVERGSSSIRAAMDVVILLEKRATAILVVNDKQKDDEPSKGLSLRLETVELEGGTPEKPRRSAILIRAPLSGDESEVIRLTSVRRRVLEALVASEVPLASGEWQRRILGDDGQPMTRYAFQKHRSVLVEKGLAKAVARHYYAATETGRKCT